MPQMSPIWWSTLFFMFITIYMMYMIIMYFSMSYNIPNLKTLKTPMKYMNWMW